MTRTFGKRYLAELEQLLQAEAQLRRDGTELLDDPEYRALREQFIEGDLTLDQLSERVDALAVTRSDEDPQAPGPRRGEGGANGAERHDPADDLDDDGDSGANDSDGGSGGSDGGSGGGGDNGGGGNGGGGNGNGGGDGGD